MKRHLIFSLAVALAVVGVPRAALRAQMQIRTSMNEVAQAADLIFVGTVDRMQCRVNDAHTMAFTDVYFGSIDVISAKTGSVQRHNGSIKLSYAGGACDSLCVTVSGTPEFNCGARYIVCAADDGREYVNPIVGGEQGMFIVSPDETTGTQYVLTAGRRPVIGTSAEGLEVGSFALDKISGDMAMISSDIRPAIRAGSLPELIAASEADSVEVAVTSDDRTSLPMTLDEFRSYLCGTALKQVKRTSLFRGGVNLESQANYQDPGSDRTDSLLWLSPNSGDAQQTDVSGLESMQAGSNDASILGGTLNVCGYRTLPVGLEQVPRTSWTWLHNGICLGIWNRFLDLFHPIQSDGFRGGNRESEIAAFLDDSALFREYGIHWNKELAFTISWSIGSCGRIVESDIVLNPAYKWTTDPATAFGNSEYVLLRPALMHELAHTWGEQSGSLKETYDYDVPTVMHGYYSDVVEDGNGIHAIDAKLLRRRYRDQSTPRAIRDVGVESYYAKGGLVNSTTDRLVYTAGQSITFQNVTVENNGAGPIFDLRLRFFLSKDRKFDASDYQIGKYWRSILFWGELSTYWTLKSFVPTAVPAGEYYVLAVVTINGFDNDDFLGNNVTWFPNKISVRSRIPTIIGMSAASGERGRTYQIGLSGTGFVYGMTSVRLGPGIAVGQVMVQNETTLTASVTVGERADLGPRDLEVSNSGSNEASAVLPNAFAVTATTGAESAAVPSAFALAQNFPNPFNPSTTIRFIVPKAQKAVRLAVYDILGNLVWDTHMTDVLAGAHECVWVGNTNDGRSVASGVYIYRLTADGFNATKQMTLVR
jgi:hypothetical protein